MTYSLRGNLGDSARVIVIDQLSGVLENAYAFSSGEWELITNDNNYKIVLARKQDSGESCGYSNVIPIEYIANYLAINGSGDLLSINNSGDTLSFL